ncbi:glutamine--tRNA ligase-like protein [Tanacetum coccineum]
MCVHGASASAIYSEGLWLYSELQLFKVKYPLLGVCLVRDIYREGRRGGYNNGTQKVNALKGCMNAVVGLGVGGLKKPVVEVVDAEKNVESEKPVAQEAVTNGCHRSTGNLLYKVATKFPANALVHRPMLLQYILSSKIKTRAQLDAAFASLNLTGSENL